jgi:glycosyltransferase involved in cell wall biosynthesis
MAYEHILNSNEYDVIVTHNLLDCVSIPLNRKNILHLHGYPSSLDSTRKACLKIPTKIIAVSDYIKQKWNSLANIDNFEVATNGVSGDYFKPIPNVKKKYDLIFIGRLITIKGVNYLIEAVSFLKNNFPKIKVAIVGSGPEYLNLVKYTDSLNLSDNIDFIGYLPSEKLVDFYNSCRIAVFPSYDREGILTTMLEASACGLPVITTNACSMPEFLIDGKNGLLVKPESSIDIAESVSKLLLDESLRIELGNSGRKMIENDWDWTKKIKIVEKIYESI